jgi:hypothetical protein
MSAMHHDTSSDLKVVDNKLKNILEVYINFTLLCSFNQLSNLVAFLVRGKSIWIDMIRCVFF